MQFISLPSVLLGAALFVVSAGLGAQQTATSIPGVIYRCLTASGNNAFVSVPDASLRQCVKVSDTPAPAAAPLIAPAGSKVGGGDPEQVDSTISPSLHPQRESTEAHDERVKQMLAQVQKWCTDRAGKKPKAKDVQNCVGEHMQTYSLLYP